jgi:hypothetical protein
MRAWVCNLQLLLALASAVILGSESSGIHYHILLPQIRDFPNLDDQAPVPQEQGGPDILPGTGIPFHCLVPLWANPTENTVS